MGGQSANTKYRRKKSMAKEETYDEDDFPEEDDEVDVIEDEEPEEKPRRKAGRPKLPSTQLAQKPVEEDEPWQLQRIPEIFRVVNPTTKTIVAQASSVEELSLQLLVMIAKNSEEAVKNTR